METADWFIGGDDKAAERGAWRVEGLDGGGGGVFGAEDCEEGGAGDGPVGGALGAASFRGGGVVVGRRHFE